MFSGKETGHADEFGPGDIGAVAKLKETRAGDWLAERDEPISMPRIELPSPVMAFAMEAEGDEDKVFTALRRLQEEDPTIDLHRDPQTGDQIVAGLSQMHVEVIVDRLKERFGCSVTLKPPRVPYQETIRGSAKAHGRHKKQSGGRGQFGDCHIETSHCRRRHRLRVRQRDQGRRDPDVVHPRGREGRQGGHGATARSRAARSRAWRVRVFDGTSHAVDSSEMAFKMAGSIAMREAMRGRVAGAAGADHARDAGPCPTNPSATSSATSAHGAGAPQGMEASLGGMTEIKAEVPMAELLTYAPDLRSITGGQGDYTMEFQRYEEVPGHLQRKHRLEQAATAEEAVERAAQIVRGRRPAAGAPSRRCPEPCR